LDKLIYPSIVLEKKLPQLHPETFEEQEPMPKSCESFKSGIISSGGEIYF